MQSRVMSLFEAVANVIVGFVVAIAAQVLIFPLFCLHVTAGENLAIAALFTVVSLARSYALRRAFNWLGARRSRG